MNEREVDDLIAAARLGPAATTAGVLVVVLNVVGCKRSSLIR